MKIVNRETFLAMPANTVFSKYQPCVFGQLMIKGESVGGVDFCEQGIVDGFEWYSTEEFVAQLDSSQNHGASISMNFDEESRDGAFNKDQLFAVWDNADILQLIVRLKECVK